MRTYLSRDKLLVTLLVILVFTALAVPNVIRFTHRKKVALSGIALKIQNLNATTAKSNLPLYAKVMLTEDGGKKAGTVVVCLLNCPENKFTKFNFHDITTGARLKVAGYKLSGRETYGENIQPLDASHKKGRFTADKAAADPLRDYKFIEQPDRGGTREFKVRAEGDLPLPFRFDSKYLIYGKFDAAGVFVISEAQLEPVAAPQQSIEKAAPATSGGKKPGGGGTTTSVAAPTSLTGSFISPAIKLSWVGKSTLEEIEVKKTNVSTGAITTILLSHATAYPNAASPLSGSYSDTAITAGKTYSYKIRAKVGSSYSVYVTSQNITIPVSSYPTSVQNLSAAARDCATIDVSWGAPFSSGSAPLRHYMLWRNNILLAYFAPTDMLRYYDTQAVPGSKNVYRVTAENTNGDRSQTSTEVQTPLCDLTVAFPKSVEPEALSCNQTNLILKSPPAPAGVYEGGYRQALLHYAALLKEYRVYRDGVFTEIVDRPAFDENGNSWPVKFFDILLPPQSTHHYRVTWVDTNGLERAIGEVTATTPPCPVIPAGSPKTVGPWRLLVVPLKFSDDLTPPTRPARKFKNQVFGRTQDFYVANSYGKHWFTGTMLDWTRLTLPRGSNTSLVPEDLHNNLGINLGQYDAVVYVIDNTTGRGDGLAWGGLARGPWGQIGTAEILFEDTPEPYSAIHEMGHSISFGHARTWDCGAQPLSLNLSSCSQLSDRYDPMGMTPSGKTPHFSALLKNAMGWMPMPMITQSGEYTIAPLETISAGTKAYQVLLYAGGTSHKYRIEYLKDQGISLSFDLMRVNLNPAVPELGDVLLKAGQTFVDPFQGIRFTNMGQDSAGARIKVENYVHIDLSLPQKTLLGVARIAPSLGDGAGDIARVEFYQDGVLKATDSSAPFEYAWDTSAETHGQQVTWSVIAFDRSGKSGSAQTTTLLDLSGLELRLEFADSLKTLWPAISGSGNIKASAISTRAGVQVSRIAFEIDIQPHCGGVNSCEYSYYGPYFEGSPHVFRVRGTNSLGQESVFEQTLLAK